MAPVLAVITMKTVAAVLSQYQPVGYNFFYLYHQFPLP